MNTSIKALSLAAVAALSSTVAVGQVTSITGSDSLTKGAGAAGGLTGTYSYGYNLPARDVQINSSFNVTSLSVAVGQTPPAVQQVTSVSLVGPGGAVTPTSAPTIVNVLSTQTASGRVRNKDVGSVVFKGTVPQNGVYTFSLLSGTAVIGTASFTVVPEPETYAVAAALGLVGFGIWRRRA